MCGALAAAAYVYVYVIDIATRHPCICSGPYWKAQTTADPEFPQMDWPGL
jgi:hypothetical protein